MYCTQRSHNFDVFGALKLVSLQTFRSFAVVCCAFYEMSPSFALQIISFKTNRMPSINFLSLNINIFHGVEYLPLNIGDRLNIQNVPYLAKSYYVQTSVQN